MKAILRRARISPKKANLVAGMVRRKKVREALALLSHLPKKAGHILYKVIQSAASNAKNNFNQPFDQLEIIRILVTPGPTYKRSLPVSRGRSHPILKRTAHITVDVGVPGVATPVKGSASTTVTTEQAAEEKPEAKKAAPKKTAAKRTSAPAKKTSAKKTPKAN